MKKRWNTRRIVPVSLLLVLILTCGAVFAYMFMRTTSVNTEFVPAVVACEVTEEFENSSKSDITVKNTGNIPAYLRVRLVTYWVDSDGNVAPKSSPELTVPYNGTDWVAGSENTFYYKVPVASEGVTTTLLTAPITLTTEEGYRQVVDVFGEAIQSNPTDAVKECWPVTLSDTTIISSP